MCSKSELQIILSEIPKTASETFGEHLDSVILYGSYARGDYDDESDVDVMAMLNLPRAQIAGYRDQVSELAFEIGLKYDVLLSVKLQEKAFFDRCFAASPFYQNVTRDGIRIDG